MIGWSRILLPLKPGYTAAGGPWTSLDTCRLGQPAVGGNLVGYELVHFGRRQRHRIDCELPELALMSGVASTLVPAA